MKLMALRSRAGYIANNGDLAGEFSRLMYQ